MPKTAPKIASGIAAALVLAGLAGAGAAQAQSNMAFPRTHDPCLVDVQTYCANAPSAHGAIRQCLAMHMFHLSAECRKAMTQVPPARSANGH